MILKTETTRGGSCVNRKFTRTDSPTSTTTDDGDTTNRGSPDCADTAGTGTTPTTNTPNTNKTTTKRRQPTPNTDR